VSANRQLIDQRTDILIAEDSPTQAQRLQHILVQHGYDVRRAANGRLALDAARLSKPALIISDVVMPEMDGYELCRQVKADATLADIPVILVTTLSDPGDVIRGLECRADNFILKPYDEPYLVSRVQFVLMNRVMRQTEQGGIAVEIFFNGQRHTITADRLQILNLLLSTYDAAIQRNKELTRAQEELTRRGAVLAQREGELQEAQAFLKNLIAASPSIVFRLEPADDDFRVMYVSENIGWLLGYAVEEVVSVPRFWQDIIHPDDREVVLLRLRAALQGTTAQVEQEYRCLAKDGRYRWFLSMMRIEYHEQSRPAAILCHTLDITDRKRAQEEMRRAESFLDSLFENIPNPISVKDARELRYVRLNRAFEDLVGHARSEMLGKTQQEFLPAEEAELLSAKEREVIDGRTLVDTSEALVHTATRGVRIMHSRTLPIVDEKGVPQYVLSIGEDITDRKASEQALAAAKLEVERASHAKSEFLSRMSHDLRTPLNAILGFAQLLELDSPGERAKESIAHILRGGEHLLALINEVLDIARIEAGHLSLSPEPVHALEIVELAMEMVRPLAGQRSISLAVEKRAGEGVVVFADRHRLNQILLNLMSNAVKYNSAGGRVTVGFEKVGARMRISVTDTGAGIPPEKLALLFQPFERLGADQTAVEGTGLGLALSRGLAEAMGGALGVASEVDQGSTFWVELALTDAPERPVEVSVSGPPAASSTPPDTTGVVLYIEDNRSNVRLMERVLERRPGVRLLHAPTGEDGMSMAQAQRPDLILLDLHLPDISGEEVLQHLWQDPELRKIPVAVLSADATPAQVRRLQASGALAYLTKPLDISRVIRLVDDALNRTGRAATDAPRNREGQKKNAHV
jgi:PAS domain S-box-containing protein